jgi:hypothetical protein
METKRPREPGPEPRAGGASNYKRTRITTSPTKTPAEQSLRNISFGDLRQILLMWRIDIPWWLQQDRSLDEVETILYAGFDATLNDQNRRLKVHNEIYLRLVQMFLVHGFVSIMEDKVDEATIIHITSAPDTTPTPLPE